MRFSETVKLARPDLYITHAHDAWLARNDHPVYSKRAIEFATQQLSKKGDRDRTGTLSASGLGDCIRYQQFVFIGMSKMPPDPPNIMRMHNGVMMHLRWQMAGLTAGWLADVEVPVAGKELGLTGTMDGLTPREEIVEIKSINAHGYSALKAFGPKPSHDMQMAAYMISTGLSKGIFIYENKDTQDYREIPVQRADMPVDQVRARAKDIYSQVHLSLLAEPLGKCIDQEGWQYRSCPFRDRCLGIRTWSDVA